jgi:RHS repeat-associated protein
MEYSQRDVQQPMTFTYTNFGNKWTTGWLSYVQDDASCTATPPASPTGFYAPATIIVQVSGSGGVAGEQISTGGAFCASLYRRGGGSEPYIYPTYDPNNPQTLTSPEGQFSQALLTRNVDSNGNVTSFVRNLPDGSVERFTLPGSPGQFFMSEVDNPQGNAVKIGYDDSMRIVTLTDAIGQVTTLCYSDSPSPCIQPPASTAPTTNLQVTQVIDPFGRSASFGYDPSTGHLISITDVLGITSSFIYTPGSDFINTLTTPYGTTQFQYTDATTENAPTDTSRSVTITDPLGRVSRVEYRQGSEPYNCDANGQDIQAVPGYPITCQEPKGAPATPGSLVSFWNAYLNYRNTFIWNSHQYAAVYNTSYRYLQAKIIHWLHTDDSNPSTTSSSRIPESVRPPLDARVWFQYPFQVLNVWGQPDASHGIGATNQPTMVARLLDNGTTQMWQYQYNAYGKITQVTDPIGRQLTMTYAANGIDLSTVTNTTVVNGTAHADLLLALSNYNTQHEPQQIQSADGQVTTISYNAMGQLQSITDPLNNTWQYTYSTPTGGFLQQITGPAAPQTPQYLFTYDSYGRILTSQGPDGRLLTYSYDAANRLTKILYPDQTSEIRGYTLLDLTAFTDRRGNTTSRKYDADRELYEIDEPAGRTTKLSYWPDGAVQTIQDPLNNITQFATDIEGRIQTITYPDGTQLNRAYDGVGRLLSVTPGQPSANNAGVSYTYNTDNTVSEIAGGQPSPTLFTYDPAYRRWSGWTQPQPNGGPVYGQETYSYGPVGAVGANLVTQDILVLIDSTKTSPPATQISSVYSYDQLNRVSGRSITVGSESFVESWSYDGLGRLTSNQNAGGNFAYSYSDATYRVAQRTNAGTPSLSVSYYPLPQDGLPQQLTYGAPDSSNGVLAQLAYAYDANHNVTSLAESGLTTQSSQYGYDQYNQLTSAVIGSTNLLASYDLSGNMLRSRTIPGVPLQLATTYGTENEILTRSDFGITQTATYDPLGDGNLQSIGEPTYLYDPLNRLTQITSGGNPVTNFSYDGIGRLTQIVEMSGGKVTANHSYVWCGRVRCLELDNTQTPPAPDRVYYAQGSATVAASGGQAPIITPAYELSDLLGSVTAVYFNGTIRAQYAYGLFGGRTTVSGTASLSDRGFAGYFYHATSGLQFTRHRVYSGELGRWLTRDPIGNRMAFAHRTWFNATDLNLYAYARNNPTTLVDPIGLNGGLPPGWGWGWGAKFAAGILRLIQLGGQDPQHITTRPPQDPATDSPAPQPPDPIEGPGGGSSGGGSGSGAGGSSSGGNGCSAGGDLPMRGGYIGPWVPPGAFVTPFVYFGDLSCATAAGCGGGGA